MQVTILKPIHTSHETALIIPDYPTGRRARCVKRMWIEDKPRHGQRSVYQTSQPKYKMERRGWKEGEPVPDWAWRQPKRSTYSPYVVFYETEDGHVHHAGIYPFWLNDSAARGRAFALMGVFSLSKEMKPEHKEELRGILTQIIGRAYPDEDVEVVFDE